MALLFMVALLDRCNIVGRGQKVPHTNTKAMAEANISATLAMQLVGLGKLA